ncbi:MAG: hypothetical protein ABEK59_11635 [Halobacteria archaeon]
MADVRAKIERNKPLIKELLLFIGGLLIMFTGFILVLGVVTAIIGIPLILLGFMMYKASAFGSESGGAKIDYREEPGEGAESTRHRREGDGFGNQERTGRRRDR